MKKIVIFTLSLFFLLGNHAAAQSNKAQKDSIKKVHIEELKKLRKDLFTKKLELTEKEADAFFPIYDEYQTKLREAKKAFRNKWKDKKPEDLTETEADGFLKDAIALREKELELYKTYSEKLKTAIPLKKLVLLHRVEKEVQHELMEKAREWRKDKPGKPQGGKGKKKGKHPGPPPGPPPMEED